MVWWGKDTSCWWSECPDEDHPDTRYAQYQVQGVFVDLVSSNLQ